uniref:Uncharacterized protein n=1 Tax=Romanomermis culicivorax TaxID=13658 RepID=A0A915HNX9_ROMCU
LDENEEEENEIRSENSDIEQNPVKKIKIYENVRRKMANIPSRNLTQYPIEKDKKLVFPNQSHLDFCLIFMLISLDANLVYDPICQTILDHAISGIDAERSNSLFKCTNLSKMF